METLARCLIVIVLVLLSFIGISSLFRPAILALVPRAYQKCKANGSADKAGHRPQHQDRHGHCFSSPEYFRPRTQSPGGVFVALGNVTDPYIQPTDAVGQISRIAETRDLSSDQKIRPAELVGQHIKVPKWSMFGGPRVNVVEIIAAIDNMFGKPANEGGDHH